MNGVIPRLQSSRTNQKMKSVVILSEAYSARIDAVEAILRVADDVRSDGNQLRTAASHLDKASVLFGRATIAASYAALAEVFRIAALLIEWRSAVLEAKPEGDRFLRAAIEVHKTWLSEYQSTPVFQALLAAMDQIQTLGSIREVAGICRRIAAVPLPIGVFAPETGGIRLPKMDVKVQEDKPDPAELAVAFLRFVIDGVPAAETHFLTPREAHDLEIEV